MANERPHWHHSSAGTDDHPDSPSVAIPPEYELPDTTDSTTWYPPYGDHPPPEPLDLTDNFQLLHMIPPDYISNDSPFMFHSIPMGHSLWDYRSTSSTSPYFTSAPTTTDLSAGNRPNDLLRGPLRGPSDSTGFTPDQSPPDPVPSGAKEDQAKRPKGAPDSRNSDHPHPRHPYNLRKRRKLNTGSPSMTGRESPVDGDITTVEVEGDDLDVRPPHSIHLTDDIQSFYLPPLMINPIVITLLNALPLGLSCSRTEFNGTQVRLVSNESWKWLTCIFQYPIDCSR